MTSPVVKAQIAHEKQLVEGMNICPTCHRTDVFSPGVINHDIDWHDLKDRLKVYKKHPEHNRKPRLPKFSLEIKNAC
jgi:hypothetical protein